MTPAPVTLADLLQQPRFESPAQEAVLNVLATEAWLSARMTTAFEGHRLTPAQFNVLRILRGRHPEPTSCSQIGGRLLDRTPDVTRLVARLEAAGLVTRAQAAHDRRAVDVAITPAGLAALAALDAPVRDEIDRATRHLSDAELAALSALLEKLRTDQEAPKKPCEGTLAPTRERVRPEGP